MNLDDAFKLLSLPMTASEQDIQKRYRELALTMHSDVGGDNDQMVRLNEARNMALGTPTTALVPLSATLELLKATTSALIELTASTSHDAAFERAGQQVLRRRTVRLKHVRRTAATLGAVCAAMAVLLNQKLDLLTIGASLDPYVQLIFWQFLGVFAISYAAFSLIALKVERLIEDCKECLSDKIVFIGLFRSLSFFGSNGTKITRYHLSDILHSRIAGDRYRNRIDFVILIHFFF